jgi:hypothetical protein
VCYSTSSKGQTMKTPDGLQISMQGPREVQTLPDLTLAEDWELTVEWLKPRLLLVEQQGDTIMVQMPAFKLREIMAAAMILLIDRAEADDTGNPGRSPQP